MPMPDADLDDLIASTRAAGDDELDKLIAQQVGPKIDWTESLGRGAAQGATFGFGDEIAGAYDAAASAPGQWFYEFKNPDAPKSASFAERYAKKRDSVRAANEAARLANPKTYFAGEIAGSLAPSLLTAGAGAGTAAGRLAIAAGQGATQGLGYSDATSATGLLGDTALGAGVGLAGFGIGKAAGAGLSGLASKGAAKAAQADAAALAKATEAKLAEQASLVGKYGGLRQTENKAIRNLLDLEKTGELTPKNKIILALLKKEGRVAEALNEAAANDLEFLGSRTPEVSAAKAAMLEGKSALPEAIQKEAARLASPDEAKAQLYARLVRYGLPLAGSAIGTAVGGPVGGAVGALAGAGTRPMMHALGRMATHPSVQKAVWGGIESATSAPLRGGAFGSVLRQALAGAMIAPVVDVLEEGRNHDPMASVAAAAQRSVDIQQAAQEGGKTGAAAAYYDKSQRDPNFRKLTSTLLDDDKVH